jgi:hypothetical protein
VFEPLVLNQPGQRYASSFNANFDVVRARQQVQGIVDELFDLVIVGRTEGLAAPHCDACEQCGNRDTRWNFKAAKGREAAGRGRDGGHTRDALTWARLSERARCRRSRHHSAAGSVWLGRGRITRGR